MRTIADDDLFLEYYYKCYNNLRIFIVTAIAAAKGDEFRKKDATNRTIVANERERAAEDLVQQYSTLIIEPTSRDVNQTNSTNHTALHREAEQAITTLVKFRQEEWYILIQEILDGKTENSELSKEERELLRNQFKRKEDITVVDLLATIKDNLIKMIQRAIKEAKCHNPNDRTEREYTQSFKRWLRWNRNKIQEEINFLLFVESHFIANLDAELKTDATITQIMQDVDKSIAVASNPPKHNEVRQSMRHLSSRVFPDGKRTARETPGECKKNKMLLKIFIQRLSNLVNAIIAEEDFAWYLIAAEEINAWKEQLFSKRKVILERYHTTLITEEGEQPYNIKAGLDELEEKFSALKNALDDDEELKKNTNESFDVKCAHLLAEETSVTFRELKKHFKTLQHQLDENFVIRFFRNIFSALCNPMKTLELAAQWCTENPWTTVGISVLVLSLIALTAFAPYTSPLLVALFAVAAPTADIIAGSILAVGAVSLGVVVVTTAAGAGSLVRVEERNEISKLESTAEEAEKRANTAEQKAKTVEAEYRRRKATGFSSEAEDIDAENVALMARLEANNARKAAIHANKNLETARARKIESTALLPTANQQEITRFNIQAEEDYIDARIDSLDEGIDQINMRWLALGSQRVTLLGNIIERREHIEQSLSLVEMSFRHSPDASEINAAKTTTSSNLSTFSFKDDASTTFARTSQHKQKLIEQPKQQSEEQSRCNIM